MEDIMTKQNGPLPTRDLLNKEETWDLSLLFVTQAEYEKAIEALKEKVATFNTDYKGNLTNVGTILSALNDFDDINVRMGKVFQYGSLAYEVDKLDDTNEANALKLGQLSEWLGVRLSFFESELANLSEEMLNELSVTEEGQKFKAFIDRIKYNKPMMLDPMIEETLSSLSGSLMNHSDMYNTVKFQDMVFPDFVVGSETYSNSFAGFEQDFEGHMNKEIRHAA